MKLELMQVMTQSAFAHQHALLDLEGCRHHMQRMALMTLLEETKSKYYDARTQLEMMDPESLVRIEEEINFQKEMVFGSTTLQ